MTTQQKTDLASECGDESCLIECAYCGRLFDYDREGHIDEDTDIAFCDAPCEMHYDAETGLPDNYILD